MPLGKKPKPNHDRGKSVWNSPGRAQNTGPVKAQAARSKPTTPRIPAPTSPVVSQVEFDAPLPGAGKKPVTEPAKPQPAKRPESTSWAEMAREAMPVRSTSASALGDLFESDAKSESTSTISRNEQASRRPSLPTAAKSDHNKVQKVHTQTPSPIEPAVQPAKDSNPWKQVKETKEESGWAVSGRGGRLDDRVVYHDIEPVTTRTHIFSVEPLLNIEADVAQSSSSESYDDEDQENADDVKVSDRDLDPKGANGYRANNAESGYYRRVSLEDGTQSGSNEEFGDRHLKPTNRLQELIRQPSGGDQQEVSLTLHRDQHTDNLQTEDADLGRGKFPSAAPNKRKHADVFNRSVKKPSRTRV